MGFNANEVFQMAMGFEKDSIVFFLSMQESAEKGKGREMIGQLVYEEMGHLKNLSQELRKLACW